MSIWSRLFGQTEPSAWNSGWEAVNHPPHRNRLTGTSPVDSSVELSSSTRRELVKASRYVAKNSGLARELKADLATYSVGSGLRVKPQRGSDGWKIRSMDVWDQWSKAPTICGRYTMTEVTRMISFALETDGEIFVLKTVDPENKSPRIQLIEGHRVGNWGNVQDSQDGIRYDKWGRVRDYCIIADNAEGYRYVKGSSMLHIHDPERSSANRAAPSLSHSSAHIRDELELLDLEKHAAKVNCDVAYTLMSESPGRDDLEFNPVDDGDSDDTTDPVKLQSIIGGKTISLKNGEKLESFESSRPNSAFTGFLDHLGRSSALGILPYEFTADPSKPTGAGIRLVVSKAARKFEWRTQLLIARLIEPLWFYVIGTAVANRQLTGPSGWQRIKVGAPRSVTVDAGRERREDRADVQAGIKNLGDLLDEQGKDVMSELEQRAREIAHVRDLAEQYGLRPEAIFNAALPAVEEEDVETE